MLTVLDGGHVFDGGFAVVRSECLNHAGDLLGTGVSRVRETCFQSREVRIPMRLVVVTCQGVWIRRLMRVHSEDQRDKERETVAKQNVTQQG